jgi:ketosteroid isomerase-like protein
MSLENVEVVRRSFEAGRDRRFDLAVEAWHPQGEWRPAMAGVIEGRVYCGHAALRRYFDDLFQSFSEVRVSDLEFRDLGDRVLLLYRLSVRGHDSGISIDQRAGAVYELRDGKIVNGHSYLSREQALEAVGLSE